MSIAIDPSRLAKLETANLLKGSHNAAEGVGCVMNWSNFLAGDSGASDDHPWVRLPIRRLLIVLNDRLGDEDRQRLKPYVAKVLGTASAPEVERARAWMAAGVAIRTVSPMSLELAGL